MVNYCTTCGNKAVEGNRFCTKCGTTLVAHYFPPKDQYDAKNALPSTNPVETRRKLKLRDAVAAFICGDEFAFNDIYTHTYRKVRVTADAYLKNHADAEDAVQDIYFQIYKKLNTIQEIDKSMSWIMTITRNTCLNKLDKRNRSEITLDEGEDSVCVFEKIEDERTGSSPESSLFKREHSSIILGMVANLPLEQKDVVMLHYIEQRSVADIAMLTNTTTGTVKSRLNYARKKLKDLVLAEERNTGVKLHSKGLFLFLPIALRFFAKTIPLSADTAAMTLEGVATATKTGIVITSETTLSGGVSAGASTTTATAASAVAVENTAGIAVSCAGAKTVAASLICTISLAGAGLGLSQAANNPITIDEWISTFDTLVAEEIYRSDRKLIERTLNKADTLASQGDYDWAEILIDNALFTAENDPVLLEAFDVLKSTRTTPLFDLGYTRESGNIKRLSSGVDVHEREYDTYNFYIMEVVPKIDTHVSVALNGEYTRLTGTIVLNDFYSMNVVYSRDSSFTFSIIGDGIILFEHNYTNDGLDNRLRDEPSSMPVDIDINVTGVDLLDLDFSLVGGGGRSISKVGLVDFVVYQASSGQGSILDLLDTKTLSDKKGKPAVSLEEWFSKHNKLLLSELRNEESTFPLHISFTVSELAAQGYYDLAANIIEYALEIDSKNQLLSDLSDLIDEIDVSGAPQNTPMFDNYIGGRDFGSVVSIRRNGGTDINGNPFSAAKYDVADSHDMGDYVLISLNSGFTNLTGRVVLLDFVAGIETQMLRIIGDGNVLFEHMYLATSDSWVVAGYVINDDAVDIDVNVEDVDVLEIQFISKNNDYNSWLAPYAHRTKASVALIDFMLWPNSSGE